MVAKKNEVKELSSKIALSKQAEELRRGPRPISVQIASFFSMIFVLISAILIKDGVSILGVIPITFASLITVGIWMGNRLARQWAVMVGGVTGLFLGVNALFSLNGECLFVLFYGIGGMAALAIVVFLNMRSSKDFFAVVCPSCRSAKTLPSNFFYTKQRCRACGHQF